jgi:NADH:ubiquinone oxidoreductase subunit E
MTTSNLILEIVQLFKQIDKKASQKELIEILRKIQKGEQWKD